jgi:integrase
MHDVPLVAMSPALVREWYATAMRGTGGRSSIAQSYRLLRAVMNTAVRDGAIVKNPCQIKGAGSDRAKERPVASPDQVAALVDAITPRYRAFVLLAAWCGFRRGEIIGIHRADVDVEAGTITIRHNRVELLESPEAFDADPKTDAGKRTVTVPPHVVPVLRQHIEDYAGRDQVFVGRKDAPMRGNAAYQAFARARKKVGMDGFTLHDMRHTGQTLAAATGATIKDLTCGNVRAIQAEGQRFETVRAHHEHLPVNRAATSATLAAASQFVDAAGNP